MANALTSFKEVNNLGFDISKTESLVEGLKKDGVVVGIEDLSSYIRKQGLIVEEHIGRHRNYVNVSPKLFGVDLTSKSADTNDFFKEHIKMGKISFIQDSDEKKLTNIEATVRMQRKRNSIGYDSKFMTMDSYHSFIELVDQKRKEYFDVRDQIVSNWDVLMARFKEKLMAFLNELNAIDKENVFSTIMSRIPSKQAYAQSFYMTIGAKAFPVTENLDMFSDDIQSQIKEGLNQETISTLYEIVGNTLNDAFDSVSKVIVAIQHNDKIASKTLGAIKKTAQRIGQKNIFNNPKIEEIKADIMNILQLTSDKEVMAEEAEILVAKIYGYAKELGIESAVSLKESPLSEDELLDTFAMLQGTSFEDEDTDGGMLEKMRA